MLRVHVRVPVVVTNVLCNRALAPGRSVAKSFIFEAGNVFSWNFNSSLKVLECQVLLPVGKSLKITVLFTFARSLKRIATCKLSRHVETHLVDLKLLSV